MARHNIRGSESAAHKLAQKRKRQREQKRRARLEVARRAALPASSDSDLEQGPEPVPDPVLPPVPSPEPSEAEQDAEPNPFPPGPLPHPGEPPVPPQIVVINPHQEAERVDAVPVQQRESPNHSGDEEDNQVLPPSQPFQWRLTEPVIEPRKELVRALAAVRVKTNMSDSSMNALLQVLSSRIDTFHQMVDDGEIGQSYVRDVRGQILQGLPKFSCGALVSSGDPPVLEYRVGLRGIPAYLYKSEIMTGEKLLCQDTTTTVEEVKQFHKKTCVAQGVSHEDFLSQCGQMDLSMDGVKESNSSKRNFWFVSLRLGTAIYLLKAYNPLMGHTNAKPTADRMLRDVIESINADPDLRLRHVIADTPARLTAKGIMSHTGRWACETCTATAKTKPVHWPYQSSKNAPRRTAEEMKEATLHLHDWSTQTRKGVIDDSPLYDVDPPFCITRSIPVEEFHLLKEGLTKSIMKRLFEDSCTVTSRAIFSEWQEVMERLAVFSEMSRRPGKLNTGNMKGSEFGLVLFAGFLPLIDVMGPYESFWAEARDAIGLLSFMSKAYNLSNEDLRKVEEDLARNGLSFRILHKKFYKAFEASCCRTKTPTPNVHAFYHLYETRKETALPLHAFSAEPFEAMYAVVRRCFQPGTRNTPLQCMQNGYLRLLHISHHGRTKRLHINNNPRNRAVRDSVVVTKAGEIYEVEPGQDNPWIATRIRVSPYDPKMKIALPWHLIGVHRYLEHDRSVPPVFLQYDDIATKAMQCGNVIISWEKEMLMSKVDD